MKLAIFLFCSIGMLAQVAAPQMGLMLDRHGVARPVFGVAASVTLGDPAAIAVLSSACSSQLCLLKTQSAILASGTTVKAPAGPAVFALNGASAYVYFPRSRLLELWRNGTLTPVPLNVTGEIVSMLVGNGALEFAVDRQGAVSIVDPNNAVLGSLPSAPAMLTAAGAVYAASDAVVLRKSDASEMRWPLENIEQFFALGDGYVEIRTAAACYALRTTPGREQLFELPEIAR